MLRKIISSIVLLGALAFLGCTSSNSPTPEKKEELVVGLSVNYAPIAFKNEGKVDGLEADFALALAKELNRELRIKILPWEQLPLALKGDVIDIVMAGVSITKERERFAIFSDPYMNISQMAVMRVGDSAPNSVNHGYNNRIGYSFSTTGESFVKDNFHKATLKGYPTIKQGIVAVMNKEIDYFFHDAPSIWYYTAELSLKGIMGWYVPYTDERLAWAFAPENVKLRDEINLILKKWRKDGTLNRMIQKWVRVRVITPNGQKPISFE
ncbi:MAG: ABC transporter substrate-binding protein [Campylobacterota bacterium]|nr:ABC transporter substrate-binding protein [Campylobacterota bacterium]